MELKINKKIYNPDVESEMPLLWVLRDILGLTGTKYGCGIGVCGSCAVLIDGKRATSCNISAGEVVGKEITTIEGISENGSHALQKAWIELNVTQCGYCQPGQIISAASLLNINPNPGDNEIKEAMQDNICRCGTYQRIHEAIKLAAKG